MFGLPIPSVIGMKIAGALALLFVTAGASSYVTHRVDTAKLEALELRYSQAQTKAVEEAKSLQAAQDKVSLDAAVAEAQAQQKIVTVTQTITQEVTRHVTDHVACVSYGLVRVLDAAALGVDPDTLALPAGKSDDACTGITNSALAERIATDFGIARANAEQLNALEAWVRDTLQASSHATGDRGSAASAATTSPSPSIDAHVSGPAAPASWPPPPRPAG